jgi:hypothetical protein
VARPRPMYNFACHLPSSLIPGPAWTLSK